MRRLAVIAGALALLGAIGAVWLVRRYRSTIEVSPYDLAVRSVEENAAEGVKLGATPVQIGGLRALIREPVGDGHA